MPFVRSAGEMTAAVRRALADRGWMGAERAVIRNEVLGPLDGRAAERLARVAVRAAKRTTGTVGGAVSGEDGR